MVESEGVDGDGDEYIRGYMALRGYREMSREDFVHYFIFIFFIHSFIHPSAF